jgi:hypothetical protein
MSILPFLLRFRRLRLFVYFKLTTPSYHHSIRVFRFGIPLVMKTESRLFSTEADALHFLNRTGLDLPIPRLIDSIAIDGTTYTIMSRLPGTLLRDELDKFSEPDLRAIVKEMRVVLDRLWTLKQSPADKRSSWQHTQMPCTLSLLTELCGFTATCVGRTSSSVMEDLVGSSIERIRAGYRAIGNFMHCAMSGWDIKNAYVVHGRT